MNPKKRDLKELKRRLEVADPEDMDSFILVLKDFSYVLGLSNLDLSYIIDVSVPSIRRWREGITQPFPVVRKCAIEEFIKIVNNKLRAGSVSG